MKITNLLLVKDSILKDIGFYKDVLDYTFIKVVETYMNINNIKSFEKFNLSNDINTKKLLLYPFFIATSNGHSKTLFDLYGGFHALSFGPVSDYVLKEFFMKDGMFDLDQNNFYFFKIEKDKMLIKNEFINNNILDLFSIILDKEYTIKENKFKFKDILINDDLNNENNLINGIQSGFEHLMLYTNNIFFNVDEETLKFHSYKYSEFVVKQKKREKIDYNMIISEKDRLPFYPKIQI